MFESLLPSLLITFRESLETVLIIVIMVSYLSRMQMEATPYCTIEASSARS